MDGGTGVRCKGGRGRCGEKCRRETGGELRWRGKTESSEGSKRNQARRGRQMAPRRELRRHLFISVEVMGETGGLGKGTGKWNGEFHGH